MEADAEQSLFQGFGKMKFIKLQGIILPDQRICAENELYFRLDDKKANVAHYDALRRKLIFPKYARSTFDTYFNSFPLDKWSHHTRLKSLHLRLRCSGKFILRIISGFLNDKQTVSSLIYMEELTAGNENLVEVPVSKIRNGSLFFELQALEDEGEFHGGEWCTSVEEDQLNPSKIAVVICTHHRSEYIRQNVELINEQLFNDPAHSLKDDLYIYIVDNGRSLDVQKYASLNIRVIPNINAGGAGGFARGMLAATDDRQKYGFTHILLMDDDVRFEPESIARTISFLKLLRPRFADAFIGGSMIRMDKPAMIHETGALFDTRGFHPRKLNLDARQWSNVLLNEVPEFLNFFGWWYCVIPMSLNIEENLPLPIFMRLDDVEYGLRNMRQGITLNGIAVWHEPFERRHSSTLEYYYMRNFLIVGASENTTNNTYAVLRVLLNKIMLGLLYYTYDECHQVLDSVDDYYKGLDWLTAQDPETLHMQISSRTAVFQDVRKLKFRVNLREYFDSLLFQDRGLKRLIRRVTFNGYFLPANRNAIITNDIAYGTKRIGNIYRAKRVMQYDITSNRGVVFGRSLTRAFIVLVRFALTSLKLLFTLQRKNKEYRKKLPYVRTRQFWQDFLKLQG
jgi:galactofuranosylgalactofuranosylrhamnosyl-N-acetylglucosaminyl-diphospho-decaprenol beta-1,5/1,6-galactofuranosyltransferase